MDESMRVSSKREEKEKGQKKKKKEEEEITSYSLSPPSRTQNPKPNSIQRHYFFPICFRYTTTKNLPPTHPPLLSSTHEPPTKSPSPDQVGKCSTQSPPQQALALHSRPDSGRVGRWIGGRGESHWRCIWSRRRAEWVGWVGGWVG